MSQRPPELDQIEDRSIPPKLRVPIPEIPESRRQIWQRFVRKYLPRDLKDDLSEVKDAHEFSDEQRELLRLLSEKDYAALLGDADDRTFDTVGVPSPMKLRRLWLGLDEPGDWARPVAYESSKLKRTIQCSLWKAIYVSDYFDEDPKVTRELLASVGPQDMLEFFLRHHELNPRQSSVFAEPMTEMGRALPDKYVKAPTEELLAWAERRARELVKLPFEARQDYDTSLVLAVLASQLKKKEQLPEEIASLFSLSVPSWLSRQYGRLIKSIPLECQLAALKRELAPFHLLAGDPLQWDGGFFDVQDYLKRAPKHPALAEVVVQAAHAFTAAKPGFAEQDLQQSETASWLKDALGDPSCAEVLAPHDGFIQRLESAAPEAPPIQKRPRETVDRNTLPRFGPEARRQFQAVGEHFFGTSDIEKILEETEFRRWAWQRCATVDEWERRLVDGWTASYRGDYPVGLLFPPDSSTPLHDVVWVQSSFSGMTRRASKLERSIKYNRREGDKSELLWTWDEYLNTLGLKDKLPPVL